MSLSKKYPKYILIDNYIVDKLVGYFFSPPGLNDKNIVDINNNLKSNGKYSFVAMQYYNLILNRTFKVFVDKKFIYGINVGKMIGARTFGDIDIRYKNPEIYVNRKKEMEYGLIYPEDGKFLEKDKSNFRYLKSDIFVTKVFKTKWGMGNIPYSGRIVITFKKGKKLELILLGEQKVENVIKVLK